MQGMFYVEAMTEQLTEYINNCLRNDDRIVGWAFYMEGKRTLVVRIDYIKNFHSKMQILVDTPYDFESLKMIFDGYFEKYLRELNEQLRGEKLENGNR